MIKPLPLLFILLLFMSACSGDGSIDSAREQNEKRLEKLGMQEKEKDAQFLVTAASSGMLLEQISRMAVEQAVVQEVKSYARRIYRDHKRMNDELLALAQQKDLVLPHTIGDKDQKVFNDVGAQTGLKFDRAFIVGVKEKLEKCIEEYEKIARAGKDADIKAYASDSLPHLKLHLDMAHRLEKNVKDLNL